MQEILHSFILEQRKNISITGVDTVKSFSPTRIELALSGGKEKLLLVGSELKIVGFSKTNGTFTATGKVQSVKYGNGFSKFFK